MKNQRLILTTGLGILLSASLLVSAFALNITDSAQANSRLVGSVDNDTVRMPYLLSNQRIVIVGWAKDLNRPNESARVLVESPTIGQVVDEFTASTARPDVVRVFGGTELTAFNWVVPSRFNDGNVYEFVFKIYDANQNTWQEFGRRRVTMPDIGLMGAVDAISGREVSGWAIDFDGDDPRNQHTAVLLHVDGQLVATTIANKYRPDVDRYFSGRGPMFTYAGEYHGFRFDNLEIPPRFRDGRGHRIQVFALEFTEGTIKQIGGTYDRIITNEGLIQ
jgi:hypothetical protein